MTRRGQGLTLVELLVAAAILSVVLGLVTVYLGQHVRYARQTEARNEVQDKVRMVMQMVSQDLQMAGAQRYVYSNPTHSGSLPPDGSIAANVSLPSCDYTSAAGVDCLTGTDSGTSDAISVLYVTSLRDLTVTSTIDANPVCRKVDYTFSGTTLRRSDEQCFDATGAYTTPSYTDLADNILILNVQYVCSDGHVLDGYPDPSTTSPHPLCTPGSGYPRTAHVTVYGRSNSKGSGNGQPPFEYTTYSTSGAATTQTATCPAGYVCYGLARDVLLPNLKE